MSEAKSGKLLDEQQELRSADNTRLFVRHLRPQEGARAQLAFVHGFAEHGGRYEHTLRWFASRGFSTSVLDLRGHGRSGGRRTYVERFSNYLDDYQTYLRHVGEVRAELPLFAIGHSMGGLVLTRSLQERGAALPELQGAVISSPFFALKLKLPLWKEKMGHTLSRWVPWFRLPSDLDLSHLSTDPQVGEAYQRDPLVSKSATTRWFTETLQAQGRALERASQLTLPLMLQHGQADQLADPQATERFHGDVASSDKQLKLWPSMRHELFNETDKDVVFQHLLSWLEGRLG